MLWFGRVEEDGRADGVERVNEDIHRTDKLVVLKGLRRSED